MQVNKNKNERKDKKWCAGLRTDSAKREILRRDLAVCQNVKKRGFSHVSETNYTH
jgi:hypothetical protein